MNQKFIHESPSIYISCFVNTETAFVQFRGYATCEQVQLAGTSYKGEKLTPRSDAYVILQEDLLFDLETVIDKFAQETRDNNREFFEKLFP